MSPLQQMLLAGGVAKDPSYSSVALLMPFDEANGSTTFTDYSPSPKTITVVGNSTISTTQSKWGGSSLFANTGRLESAANQADFFFGSGAFTLEAWVYMTSATTGIIASLWNGTTGFSWNFGVDGTRNLFLYWSTNGTTGNFPASSAQVTLNTWTFVQASKTGTTLSLAINGGTQTNSTLSGTLASPATTKLNIGGGDGGFPFPGYVDDLRITKGVARSNTVPLAPFPRA